jgi:hypothetical protein
MKSFILFITLLLSTTVFSQEKLNGILPLQDGVVTFTEVVPVEGASQSTLYANAKRWFVNLYKSAKDVIQLDDKDAGEIIGKGVFKIDYYSRKPSIAHTISIRVKDGRYKYTISDLSYSDINGDKFTIENFPNGWFGKKKLYNNISDEIEQIVESIKSAMQAKAGKDDDW